MSAFCVTYEKDGGSVTFLLLFVIWYDADGIKGAVSAFCVTYEKDCGKNVTFL